MGRGAGVAQKDQIPAMGVGQEGPACSGWGVGGEGQAWGKVMNLVSDV